MAYFRLLYRLTGLLCVQVLGLLTALVLWLAFRGTPKRHWKWVVLGTHYWTRWSLFFMNIRIQREGEAAIPAGSLVVSNHIGTPDIFVMGACFPIFYVSKDSVRRWPLIGGIACLGGAIFIDRAKRQQLLGMVSAIRERLENGFSVVVFPEGGVTHGFKVESFKTSAFEAAVQTQSPVVPVMLRYHDDNCPSVAAWVDIGFFQHMVRLLMHPRLEVTVRVLPPVTGFTDRRELAALCQRKISEAFEAMSNDSGVG